jgi:hypothetical protein
VRALAACANTFLAASFVTASPCHGCIFLAALLSASACQLGLCYIAATSLLHRQVDPYHIFTSTVPGVIGAALLAAPRAESSRLCPLERVLPTACCIHVFGPELMRYPTRDQLLRDSASGHPRFRVPTRLRPQVTTNLTHVRKGQHSRGLCVHSATVPIFFGDPSLAPLSTIIFSGYPT